MTLIEFFDKVPIDNIAAALALRPRRVVFLGTDRKKISALLPHIRRILSARNIRSSITMRIIDRDDLSGILAVLQEVLTQEDEYIFDFTGGDDTALVALGMIVRMQSKENGVFRMDCQSRQGTLYRFSLQDGKFEAIPFDGTAGESAVSLTLRENISLYRGQVREEMICDAAAAGNQFTIETYRELNRLWKICQSDCAFWNSQVGRLGGAFRPLPEDRSVYTLSAGLRGVEESFLASLTDGKFLTIEGSGKSGIRYCRFSSPFVRDCLTKAGTLLEYKTYMTALYGIADTPYTDGGAGVVIDWDESSQNAKKPNGQKKNAGRSPQPPTTRNEIDTLLMRGFIPVFISCKNGEVSTDELYKLSTVAGRFGSRYARRVLVATAYFDRYDRSYAGDGTANHLRSRAEDMHITLIENVHRMSEKEFANALLSAGAPETE